MIEALVTKVGLDVAKFKEVLQDPKIEQIIAKNLRLAEEIGVNGTQAYVLAGEFLPGAVPYDEFKNRIDRIRTPQAQPSSPPATNEPVAQAPAADVGAQEKVEPMPAAAPTPNKLVRYNFIAPCQCKRPSVNRPQMELKSFIAY